VSTPHEPVEAVTDPQAGHSPESTGATPEPSATSPARGDDPLRGSRTSGVWVATVGLGLLLVLLVVFIAQNTDTTTVRFLALEGEAPVAVALLIATAAGILITASAGTLRILQLRRRTRRDLKRR
jgi:uncharacterized integral membrane protein